jgi:glutathione-regulated potassium-efflux system ancillary protein KefC
MTAAFSVAALWMALALIAGLLSVWLRVSSALTEIIIGMVAPLLFGADVLGTNEGWIKFLSATGAILLTFLAGAELDPSIFKLKWKEAGAVGLASFLFPFLICAGAATVQLHWEPMPSWLAGIAMSTTSAAVIYAVTLEFGLNTTEYGKTILIACFVTDVATVITLGLMFTPFTIKTVISLGGAAVVLLVLAWLTPRFLKRFGGLLSELETKYLLLALLGLGALASWADSEAVLAGYTIGMVLAGSVGRDHALIRRLRTLTFGLLTPFFFILVGSLVSIPAVIAAPTAFIFFLVIKITAKFIGVFPVAKNFGAVGNEAAYTSLLMSTGLTFGTIAALFGWSHGIIDRGQYSSLVAAVIGTAIIPTFIANRFFLPLHLLPKTKSQEAE